MGRSGAAGGTYGVGSKSPRAGEETAEVMITVKTYPNPSETYGETVCVAGVRLDRGDREWVRLYPVKFRNADFDSQFKKYEIIRVNGTYHQANDNRPESFRPRQDELEHVEWLDAEQQLAAAQDEPRRAHRCHHDVRAPQPEPEGWNGHTVTVTRPDQADESNRHSRRR